MTEFSEITGPLIKYNKCKLGAEAQYNFYDNCIQLKINTVFIENKQERE